ncbi:golgin subfamily A member 7 ERF4 protein [Rutstroemia sp. NJR-2017a BBW]|nr:golgin subfamily A member 7 ERF4 protein [Rutstroemia sp. NJR-2017a BBW]
MKNSKANAAKSTKSTEISGISSQFRPQANQNLQFLQHSYPTASHCISTKSTRNSAESFQLKDPEFTISITIRLRGRHRRGFVPTASQASSPSTTIPSSAITNAAATATAEQNRTNAPPSSTTATIGNARIPSPSHQPPYPSPVLQPTNTEQPQVRVTSPTRWSWRNAIQSAATNTQAFTTPRRPRAGSGSITGGRLQRPIYPSTPKRLKSPPEGTAIPLHHPDISRPKEGARAGADYPLLTLPEQRQQRHSASTGASLQVERSGSSLSSHRISLPRTVSIDLARSRKSGESPLTPTGPRLDKGKGRALEEEDEPKITLDTTLAQLTGSAPEGRLITPTPTSGISFDYTKADMSTDLERGPANLSPYNASGTSPIPQALGSNPSLIGIGPALSSNGTSIVGDEPGDGDDIEEWGPQHPCFPHMNPHVPLSSPLYHSTRIIRIRRDWMIEGDLAPTFSNLYPEILDPAGVSEQDFRKIIEKINEELIPAFKPWGARNIFDGVMGLLTGWIWDDLGWTGVKGRLERVEKWLEEWNRDMELRAKDPGTAPRIVSLRRTGYMNVSYNSPAFITCSPIQIVSFPSPIFLPYGHIPSNGQFLTWLSQTQLDIQVPDPEISYPATIPDEDRLNTGMSENTRISQLPSPHEQRNMLAKIPSGRSGRSARSGASSRAE